MGRGLARHGPPQVRRGGATAAVQVALTHLPTYPFAGAGCGALRLASWSTSARSIDTCAMTTDGLRGAVLARSGASPRRLESGGKATEIKLRKVRNALALSASDPRHGGTPFASLRGPRGESGGRRTWKTRCSAPGRCGGVPSILPGLVNLYRTAHINLTSLRCPFCHAQIRVLTIIPSICSRLCELDPKAS